MTWGWIATIAILVALVVGRSRLQSWIYRRWADGKFGDRLGKALLVVVAFAPILIAIILVVALARFPWNLILLLVLLFAMLPGFGLNWAMLDYQRKHVLTNDTRDKHEASR